MLKLSKHEKSFVSNLLGARVALLSIEGVGKEYQVRGKRVLAFDSLDLDVAEGEFVTIVGPSGCGKSTLLNLIVGLLRASGGRILFRGAPIDGICTKIGYVTQKDNLHQHGLT